MTTSEILKKVRTIEIKTKGLSNQLFGGEYHSAFKGRGMSFSEVREYAFGDDVRTIDWNVTARFNTPYIKVFEEERELTLMLLVDISASSLFGTSRQSKRDLITEICAVLAFSAISNNDKVGVVFFSDNIEKYIPPKKGKSHILYIIRELITMQPHRNAQTNIAVVLKFLNNIMKKRTITFLMSDFVSTNYKPALQIASKKHDLVGVHIYDACDESLPDVGIMQIEDSETHTYQWVDTSSSAFQKQYKNQFDEIVKKTKSDFATSGASLVSVRTDADYVKKLHLFFNSRR
ncbi:MAG: DUF58 domain-containing protein [Bacteroidetes bacterium]|nr:DUF58 domain-containing protein [Bacteroidota bacterium]MBK7041427.1 DUF58 domain-containing protein [Bacteroidota bacterium]MBK8330625.1 DUF58 domain-containing protein [Bacteroidota bacterium]HMT35729.1 DUF58 domain-containing protein [Chitinophagaceae bacterium]